MATPNNIAKHLGELRIGRFSGLLLIGAMLIAFAFWLPNEFYTATTFKSVSQNQAISIMLSLAILVCLSAGVFDLSIGQNLGFGTVICLLLIHDHHNPLLASVIAIVACLAVGAVNALLIVLVGIDSIIATLGTQSIVLALTEYLTNSQYAGPATAGFQKISSWQPFGIPVLVLYALAFAVIVWIVMEHTPLGRRIHATGANPEAARLVGIQTKRYMAGALLLAGLVAGVAGVLLGAQLGTVSPTIGPPYLLPTYATVFLGATQVKPGRFNVGGLLISVFLLAIGAEGLQLASGALWVPDMFNGVALIVAVSLTAISGRRRVKRASENVEAGEAAETLASDHLGTVSPS